MSTLTSSNIPQTKKAFMAAFTALLENGPKRLDPADYGGINSFWRTDQDTLKRDRSATFTLLNECGGYAYVPEILADAMQQFSGRLSFREDGRLTYCPGQFYDLEVYAAARAVLFHYADQHRRGQAPADLIKPSYTTIAQIKAANWKAGGHFLDADTCRFFHTRILPTIYGGNVFIISNQQGGTGERYYKVCEIAPDGSIDYVGKFNISTLKQAKALALAYTGGRKVWSVGYSYTDENMRHLTIQRRNAKGRGTHWKITPASQQRLARVLNIPVDHNTHDKQGAYPQQ